MIDEGVRPQISRVLVEPSLLKHKHFALADDDLEEIRERRRPENRLGFAVQMCALRYPGEMIPSDVLAFIGAQLDLTGNVLLMQTGNRLAKSTS